MGSDVAAAPEDGLLPAETADGRPPPASLTEVPIRRRKAIELGSPKKQRIVLAAKPATAMPPAHPASVTAMRPAGKLRSVPPPGAETSQPPVPAARSAPTSLRLRQEDIVAYWMRLKRGRRYPQGRDLDVEDIGIYWPDCLMLSCSIPLPGRRSDPVIARVARIDSRRPAPPDSHMLYTPMVTEWMLALAREVARTGEPLQDIERFPTAAGPAECRIILLPFGDDRSGVERILCSLCRV